MRLEVPLDGEDADTQRRLPSALASGAGLRRPGLKRRGPGAGHRRRRAPRSRGRASRSPSSIEALATRSGSAKWVVASTIARARRSGSELLKMPDPTKLPSAPSCIISAASAGVAMPPAQKSGTGRRPRPATSWTTSRGAECSLAALGELLGAQRGEPLEPVGDLAHVANGLDDVAGPGLALGADHRGALADAAQRLAEVGGAADEGHVEGELVYVVGLVGRREHLGLVYVVHLEGLEDLRLREVADPRLGHHRDGHGLLDLLDDRRVRHPRDAALRRGCRRGRARAPSPRRRRSPRRSAPARRS